MTKGSEFYTGSIYDERRCILSEKLTWFISSYKVIEVLEEFSKFARFGNYILTTLLSLKVSWQCSQDGDAAHILP
jgi:hypothetical protein